MKQKVDLKPLTKRELFGTVEVTSRFRDFKDFQVKEFAPQYSIGEIAIIEKENVYYQKTDKGWRLLLKTDSNRIHPNGSKTSKKVIFNFGRLCKIFSYIKEEINNKQ